MTGMEKMQKINGCSPLLILSVLCLILFAPRAAAAQEADQQEPEETISFGAEADLNRSYIWRGIKFNEGFLVQPSAWVSSYGLTFTTWANVVVSDNDPLVQTGLNEMDLILEYGIAARNLELVPSFTYYHYPEDQSFNTGELAIKAILPIGPVSLCTDQIVYVMEYRGAYFGDLGIEYEREIIPGLSFSSCLCLRWASAKFNENYIGLAKNAFNSADFGISFPYYLTGSLYLAPHVELISILDEELKDYLDRSPVNFGLRAGYEF